MACFGTGETVGSAGAGIRPGLGLAGVLGMIVLPVAFAAGCESQSPPVAVAAGQDAEVAVAVAAIRHLQAEGELGGAIRLGITEGQLTSLAPEGVQSLERFVRTVAGELGVEFDAAEDFREWECTPVEVDGAEGLDCRWIRPGTPITLTLYGESEGDGEGGLLFGVGSMDLPAVPARPGAFMTGKQWDLLVTEAHDGSLEVELKETFLLTMSRVAHRAGASPASNDG
jgi:hypothetical protein